MSMDLYYLPYSPPCRAVCLTARHLGVKLNFKELNVVSGEQFQPQFLKINPQHVIPTLVDGDLVLWESRAIMQYLANKFDKEGTLYPNDPKRRAKVNQMLCLDMEGLYQRFMNYYVYVAIGIEESLDPEKKKKLEEGFEILEATLQNHPYAAGEHLTIADHSLVNTVSSIKGCDIISMGKYPKISEWLSRCEKEIPGYDDVSEPIQIFHNALKTKMEEKNKK